MPSWWGKSSSKDVKKKSSKENFIDTIQRLINPASQKVTTKLGSSLRRSREKDQKCSRSAVASRSPSPSTQVSRCQSFSNTSHAHPLPLPQVPASDFVSQTSLPKTASPILQKRGKPPLHLPFPPPHSTLNRPVTVYTDTDLTTASVSSNCSAESEDTPDSATNNILSVASKGASRNSSPRNGIEVAKPKTSTLGNQTFASAPDSSLSSPARSPRRPIYPDHIPTSVFLGTRPYHDINLIGSGQCSSPGSGQTSGHNSMGGDLSSQMFWLHSRGSTECSPIPSPKMASPGPSSRIHSGAVSPLHPCACGNAPESPKQRHRLPLPPIGNPNSSYFQSQISLSNCPSPYPRSPGRQDNPTSPGLRWKKGKLIGRGTFGHVYIGFNSENGEMRAIKEVTLFSDDAKSKECAKQLGQEIALLSRLRHPNIVRYHGSDMLGDKLYIYLEYVSGGSIHKLLQEYGRFGELAIRNYTRQILSGLAYLHGMNTVHRDIKGANILVDPKGRIKLADFGMAKHITGQSCPLSFKGSPYWMAPEVIKNSNGCNLAVDIWSLGCTVLEMATSKPPWSQYEGIAAMFKIGNSKELPTIPDHLSEEGKDFVRQCLQRNPSNRPTAVQLLGHPFVRTAAPAPRPASGSEPSDPPSAAPTKSGGQVQGPSTADVQGLTIQRPKSSKPTSPSRGCQMRNMSCPVSPRAASGSSTPRRLPTAAPPHPAWTRR